MKIKQPPCWICFLNAELAKLPLEFESGDKRGKCSRCNKERAVHAYVVVDAPPDAKPVETAEQMRIAP